MKQVCSHTGQFLLSASAVNQHMLTSMLYEAVTTQYIKSKGCVHSKNHLSPSSNQVLQRSKDYIFLEAIRVSFICSETRSVCQAACSASFVSQSHPAYCGLTLKGTPVF